MATFNINVAGFCIAGLFVVIWTAALAYWKWGDVESRWSVGAPEPSARTAPGEASTR